MKTTTITSIEQCSLLNRNLDLTRNPHSASGLKTKRKSKIWTLPAMVGVLAGLSWSMGAAEISLESAPPVVVKTVPVAGTTEVDPSLTEIRVTYSKPMQDGSWSWSTWGDETFPEMNGQPRYLSDERTCVLPVKLQAGRFYATWLNSDKFKNFKDASGRPAVPYLLTFRTREESGGGTDVPADSLKLLNDDQRTVLAWTDRQFRSFFDARTFDGWSDEERATLERKLIDALNGPRSTEYYQAINTLAALRSTNALPKLRAIAFERVDRNNRDRWMSIRALGIIGDKESVPELIHLVYHGNVNTRWWAQISLVRLTGKNFAMDWNAWGKWWNDQNGQPPYKPEIIRWWNGQPAPDKLAESLEESDRKFFESLKPKSAAASAPAASADLAARLRTAMPVLEGIREAWSAAVAAIRGEDARKALASLNELVPRIREFHNTMKGTPLEAGPAEALETLRPLFSALEKGDLEAARTALQPMLALGQKMEEQVRAITDASPVPAPEPVAGLASAVVLKRDDGMQKGVQSIATSGHAVQFERSGETRYEARFVEAVQIFASRYGTPEPPQEDFHLYVLNTQQQILADLKFPYSMIERGDPKWYTLRTPSIEVPEKFTVALNFNPHQTKGVYLAYSAISGEACHSLIGLPGDGFRFWKPVEWMVRVSLTAEPTKAKGFQALADWEVPVAQDSLANCRIASFGGDKSEGQQSYGGRGPAIRFKPVELLPGVRVNTPLMLKGVRLYASRYGSGYSPEETKLHLILRDANDSILSEKDFAYTKFGYKADWVDLVFDQPVKVNDPGEPVTIAFDPGATQYKGVYFHYQKNPATSHSLAGTVAGGFKELTDREWMMRACFE